MTIELMKQALEALKTYWSKAEHRRTPDDERQAQEAITSIRQAIAEAEDNYQGSDAAKAAHMMDLYTALGLKWGDDPFAVIAKMRSIAEAEKHEVSQEPVAYMGTDIEGNPNKFRMNPFGGCIPLYTKPTGDAA